MTDAAMKMTQGAMDAQIEGIKKDVALIEKKSEEICVIASPEAEERAAEFCQQIKARIDLAEESRQFLVRPMNEHVKNINAQFKQTTGPLEIVLSQVRTAITKWRSSVAVQEAKEKAEAARQAALTAASIGDVEGVQVNAGAMQKAQEVATTKVKTQSGKTTFRKVWKYEIEDPLQLPAAYWIPDEKAIADAVKRGVVIAGVKAWQDEVPVFG